MEGDDDDYDALVVTLAATCTEQHVMESHMGMMDIKRFQLLTISLDPLTWAGSLVFPVCKT